ncbi:hypothetical protein B0H11DRAFT_2009133 [Mycena galericulata]|nr:hypothetical protein B0H11DRAFT_2009133 [Mycena galericulata]
MSEEPKRRFFHLGKSKAKMTEGGALQSSLVPVNGSLPSHAQERYAQANFPSGHANALLFQPPQSTTPTDLVAKAERMRALKEKAAKRTTASALDAGGKITIKSLANEAIMETTNHTTISAGCSVIVDQKAPKIGVEQTAVETYALENVYETREGTELLKIRQNGVGTFVDGDMEFTFTAKRIEQIRDGQPVTLTEE